MFRFFDDSSTDALSLFMHVCGDFGAAGMPGTFKKFFVDGVVQMARSMHVLTLPMPIYVDDCTLIGPVESEVNAQMEAFHDFAGDVCGVFFKVAKDRMAAQVQTALGFVWDSTTLTRELEGGRWALTAAFLFSLDTLKLPCRSCSLLASWSACPLLPRCRRRCSGGALRGSGSGV